MITRFTRQDALGCLTLRIGCVWEISPRAVRPWRRPRSIIAKPMAVLIAAQPVTHLSRLAGRKNDDDPPIFQDDVPRHRLVTTARSCGHHTPGIQCGDDVMNAKIDTLHTSVQWHGNLIYKSYLAAR